MKPYFALLLAFVLATSVARAGPQNGDDGSKSLVGTWVVAVTGNPVSICSGPQIAPAPPPFFELATYATGGTLTETNSELNFNSASSVLHVNGSDGHGVWEGEGGRFAATFRKLLFLPTGEYVADADLHEDLTVAKSGLSGSFTLTVTFLNGSPSLCSSGTSSGHRMKTE